MVRIQDTDTIIDGGYASSKEELNQIKDRWANKNPDAKVVRVKTDTKGLLMYWVVIRH